MKSASIIFVTTSVMVLALALAEPSHVHAHAIVISSTPRNGEVLTEPPSKIILQFDARIEKALARISLATSGGKQIDISEDFGSGTGDRLVVPLPPLPPGEYLLRYKVLATDGHASPGILKFAIRGQLK